MFSHKKIKTHFYCTRKLELEDADAVCFFCCRFIIQKKKTKYYTERFALHESAILKKQAGRKQVKKTDK